MPPRTSAGLRAEHTHRLPIPPTPRTGTPFPSVSDGGSLHGSPCPSRRAVTAFTWAAGAVLVGPGLGGGFLSQRQGRSSRGSLAVAVSAARASPSQGPGQAGLRPRPAPSPLCVQGMCLPCSVHPSVPAQVAGLHGSCHCRGLPFLPFLVMKDWLCVSHTRRGVCLGLGARGLGQVSVDFGLPGRCGGCKELS